MIFTELALENFGAYAGRNVIDFEPDGGRPVVLIGGQNGEGKTTILEAIQLALYGPRSLALSRRTGGYEAYLRSRTNHGAADGATVAVELTIRLSYQSEERLLRVKRSWLSSTSRPREMLEVFDGEEFSQQLSDGWAELIESLVPRGVAPLFFFDGERIEELADLEGAARTLRTAVGALLGLELVDRLGDDLKALERRHAEKAASSELRAELEEREAAVSELATSLSRARERLATLRAGVDRATAQVQSTEEAFAREGGESYEARSQREAGVEAAAARTEVAKARLRELAGGTLPLALVAGALEALRTGVGEQEERSLAERLVAVLEERDGELLAEFGVPASERDDELANWLTADRARRAPNDPGAGSPVAFSPAGSRRLESLLEHVLPSDLRELATAREVLASEIQSLEEAECRLAEVPTPDAIEDLLSARERARVDRERCLEELGVAEEEVDELERKRTRAIEDQERVMKRAAEEGLGAEDSQRILVHSERARGTLATLRERAAAHHMERIEGLIADSLRSLLRKRGLVQAVRIDPATYELSLIGRDDRPIETSQLSAGERQLTALALLWGLARAASRSLPVIIDTPLARLDASHRKLFVGRYLPSASHQVIVLSTDTEVDDKLLGDLNPALGQTYRLVHDDRVGETSIADGYFFDLPDRELLAA